MACRTGPAPSIRAMDLKISEKSALAQKQFLDKASKLLANVCLGRNLGNTWLRYAEIEKSDEKRVLLDYLS